MRPTSTPKIEHEDNFFIELDLLSFWPTKNYCSFIGIDPTTNMSGPPPKQFFAGLITILDLIEGDQDSAALTPLLKHFTGFYP